VLVSSTELNKQALAAASASTTSSTFYAVASLAPIHGVRARIALVLKIVLPINPRMRKMKSALGIAAAISLLLTVVALGAGEQKFRAEGTVQRISSDMILLRTNAADIEIKRDAKTKVSGGELRRGGSASVYYTKVAGENVATEIVMGGATKPSRQP
jgi:hypothetical protein